MDQNRIKYEIIKIEKVTYSLVLSLRLQAAFISNSLDLEPFTKGYKLESDMGPILKEEKNLNIDELRNDAHNLQVIALGACSITVDEALNLLGSKNINSNELIDNVRCVINQIRNAYAHNPLDPTWCITRSNYLKVFNLEIDNYNFSIDMEKINNNKLVSEDFGGFKGFFKMINFSLGYLKELLN